MKEVTPEVEQMSEIGEVPACGMGHSEHKPGTLGWETHQHVRIVQRAVLRLIYGAPKEDEEAFRRDYWDREPFRGQVAQAQDDADNKSDYNDGGGPIEGWKSHFYEPESRTNYRGEISPTAVTQASKYFNEGLFYRYGDKGEEKVGDPLAGHRLGLALHYLTDLSQPMHAANFTNRHYPYLRHQFFENLFDQWEPENWKPEKDSDVTFLDTKVLAEVPSLGGLVHQLAKHSKKIFDEQLKPLLDLPEIAWANQDILKKLKEVCTASIPLGETYAAALLLHWARGCDWPIKAVYKRLLEREPDPGGLATYRKYLRSGEHTAQDLVIDIARSPEYQTANERKAKRLGLTRREMLIRDVLNLKPKASQPPTEEDMSKLTWRECVEKLASTYVVNLGHHRIPGYRGISAIPEEMRIQASNEIE